MRTLSAPSLVAILLSWTLSIAACRADLGDTEAQCISKYGPEFDEQPNLGFDVVGDHAASFHVKTALGSFVLNVTFLNGAAGLEKITNIDPSRDISDAQKKALLNSESGGFKWSEKGTTFRTDQSDITSGIQRWRRSDGATAICWMSGKVVLHQGWGQIDITTKQYAAAQQLLDRQGGA